MGMKGGRRCGDEERMEMVQGCPVPPVGTSWGRGCCAGEPSGRAGFPAWAGTSGEAAEPPGGPRARLRVMGGPCCGDATAKVSAQGHEAFLAAASAFGCCSWGASEVTEPGDCPVECQALQ